MSATVVVFVAVVAAFAAVIAVALAVHQHRTAARLRGLLAHNEQSRRALAEQLVALRDQLEAAREPVLPLQPPKSDTDERREQLERLLAASAVADGPWQDTMPSQMMEFAPTEPATIRDVRRP